MKPNVPKVLLVAALTLGVAATLPTAKAFSITVTNFSFESQVLAPGNFLVATPTGWTTFNQGGGGNFDVGLQNPGAGLFSVNNPMAAPAEGNNFAWVNKFNGTNGFAGGIYQNVGALLPDTTYTLTVAIGYRNDAPPNSQPTWSPGILSLWNGTDHTGTLLGSTSGLPGAPNSWQDFTVSFTTGASVSGDLTIGLSVLNAQSIQASFDNVRLDAVAVPEPETYGIVMTAMLGGLVLLRRRRLRNS